VCRSEQGGIAVVFDSRYKIISETLRWVWPFFYHCSVLISTSSCLFPILSFDKIISQFSRSTDCPPLLHGSKYLLSKLRWNIADARVRKTLPQRGKNLLTLPGEILHTFVSGACFTRQVFEIPRSVISAILWHEGCCVSLNKAKTPAETL
jgi:hypothetical protein